MYSCIRFNLSHGTRVAGIILEVGSDPDPKHFRVSGRTRDPDPDPSGSGRTRGYPDPDPNPSGPGLT